MAARMLRSAAPVWSAVPIALGRAVVSPPDGRIVVREGPDRIGLAPAGALRILDATPALVRIVIDRGTLLCDVAPRGHGAEFVVEADPFRVRVVGTLFSVTRLGRDAIEVRVFDGVVEVSGPGGKVWRVRRGERLQAGMAGDAAQAGPVPMKADEEAWVLGLLSEEPTMPVVKPTSETPAPSADATPVSPPATVETPPVETISEPAQPRAEGYRSGSLDRWREWVIAGRYREAGEALESHLKTHPRDAEAWSLLADCRRKSEDIQGAVAAYRQVIRNGATSEADMARFKAAMLLQDKLGQDAAAIPLLQRYAASRGADPALEAEALLRLGRAYRVTGEKIKAEAVLRNVMERHRGTPAAAQARRLLESIESENQGR